MSTAVLAARQGLTNVFNQLPPQVRRLALLLLPLGLAAAEPAAGRILVEALSEAYLQVSVFVAATLGLFYALERGLKLDTAALLARHRRWQVPVAALLGALPGCGGAIVVITQYVAGRAGFGAVVAVLTATMGDAAFLLLAREPLTGLGVMALGLGVGVVSGWAVEALHGTEFMQATPAAGGGTSAAPGRPAAGRGWRRAWLALLAPGLVLGLLGAFQVDADALFGPLAVWEPALWLGFAGAVLALLSWAWQPWGDSLAAGDCAADGALVERVMADTHSVTVWVVLAFLGFELGVYFSGADLAGWFRSWAPLAPLLGVLVGLLPGCGPQLVVTTLYLNGALPLAALLGNAISNDGDALFPAIALAPRAALAATLYSAVPALLVGYGWYFLAGR